MKQTGRSWRRGAIVMTLMSLAIPAAAGAQQQVEGSFERTLSVGDRTDVRVVAGAGRIDVRPGPAGRIEVVGRIRAGEGWRRSRLTAQERVRRVETQPPVEQAGNTVRIGDLPDDLREGVTISYTLVVPPSSNLRLQTGSGSQEVSGVDGTIDISTGSGSVAVSDAGSGVHVTTGSGSIKADGVGAAFSASTGSGSIRATGLHGSISAKTGSGSVELEQTGEGIVEVSSSSGSVRVRGVRGAARASTSSGSLLIQGELVGDWQLSSSSGHVTVDLPEHQGFNIDANSNSGRIDLDFPVTVTGPLGRHAIRGPAQGGGPLLHVRTSSGGISIRKRT